MFGSIIGKNIVKLRHLASNYETTTAENNTNATSRRGKYPRYQHCGKKNHPYYKCWRKPDLRCRKCQKLGHAKLFMRKRRRSSREMPKLQINKKQNNSLLHLVLHPAFQVILDSLIVVVQTT